MRMRQASRPFSFLQPGGRGSPSRSSILSSMRVAMALGSLLSCFCAEGRMRTVYSGLLSFASFSDGIAQGDGFFFFGLGFIVGTDILQLLQLFEQALVELNGKDGRYLFSFLVSDECSGGHRQQIYGLMRISLAGLGVPDIGIDQIEEGFFLIVLEVFEVSETLQGLF